MFPPFCPRAGGSHAFPTSPLSKTGAAGAIRYPSGPCSRLRLLGHRDREAEAGPATLVLLHPDPPVVPLHDPLADREPDPAARVLLPPVQPLEHGEDAIRVVRVDADPVVGDRQEPLASLPPAGHMDPRRPLVDELDPVRDQVLEELAQLAG